VPTQGTDQGPTHIQIIQIKESIGRLDNAYSRYELTTYTDPDTKTTTSLTITLQRNVTTSGKT